MTVSIKNQQRLIKIDSQKIASDSKRALRLLGLKETELSILLVNDGMMRVLNSAYRGIDKTTDVLSFPQHKPSAFSIRHSAKKSSLVTCHSSLILGDIVINLQAAKRQAEEHKFSFRDELRWLLVHGILHLIGYAHERSGYSAKKMREKERELLTKIWKQESPSL
ncbi:MAG: rRNA maturation RNase YbeY [Nitrospirae bacterium]|nr:rRNA maturation RNase YbeY [Nitrospirota bacterium]